MTDSDHMRCALGLARRALGRVAPNPAVGCLLVQEGEGGGRIVGRGWTAPGGRPHAETQALDEAGAAAKGATAYVTLEPCAHHGGTPPCADALVEAGIARAVIAITDPDSRVDGQGIARLEAAGIPVTVGIREAEARRVNAGFFKRVRQGRPLFTLKLATSLDGRIATAAGESQWITGDPARARGHLLRAQHDAVLVGAGTARADDPTLTCRLPGLEEDSPIRVVLDANAGLSHDLEIFADAEKVPTWWVVGDELNDAKITELLVGKISQDVKVVKVAARNGQIDLHKLGDRLAEEGLTRVMVEGGSRMAASFLAAGLVDRIVWFRAGSVIGGDGLAAIAPLGVKALESAPRFERAGMLPVGADVMECFEARN